MLQAWLQQEQWTAPSTAYADCIGDLLGGFRVPAAELSTKQWQAICRWALWPLRMTCVHMKAHYVKSLTGEIRQITSRTCSVPKLRNELILNFQGSRVYHNDDYGESRFRCICCDQRGDRRIYAFDIPVKKFKFLESTCFPW